VCSDLPHFLLYFSPCLVNTVLVENENLSVEYDGHATDVPKWRHTPRIAEAAPAEAVESRPLRLYVLGDSSLRMFNAALIERFNGTLEA